MKQRKKFIKFMAAIGLLVIIPLVPLGVTKIQDDKLIEHLQVSKIKKDNQPQINKLSVVEKLSLISDYDKKNTITTIRLQDMSDENVTAIKMIINEQLMSLKNLGILTELNFDDNYMCYNYTLERYSNILDPSKSVQVYRISFTNKEANFSVLLDVDSHMIYNYSYYTNEYVSKKYEQVYIFGTKYLGLNDEETNKYLLNIFDYEMALN